MIHKNSKLGQSKIMEAIKAANAHILGLALCLFLPVQGQVQKIAPSARTNENAGIAPKTYVIGAGDILQVDVLKEPEASAASVIVRPDGMISLPLLKEIKAAGFEPNQLAQVITQKLNQYIRDADVAVLVKEIHSEKVYVIGAVRKEGPITMQGPITVLQAIAEAGGLTDYAKQHKIYVLRLANGQQNRIPFDYQAVLKGQHPEQNIVLMSTDTVVVP